MLTSE